MHFRLHRSFKHDSLYCTSWRDSSQGLLMRKRMWQDLTNYGLASWFLMRPGSGLNSILQSSSAGLRIVSCRSPGRIMPI